jgi:parallel beta-helix repeat protein
MGSLLAWTARVLRSGHSLLCTLALAASLAGCGANGPTEPNPPGRSGFCVALSYPGANGGERIQNAIHDTACATIFVDSTGPDRSGLWLVSRTIHLRSNVVLEGGGAAATTLTPSQSIVDLLNIEDQSEITIQRIDIQSRKRAQHGIRIVAGRDVTITQVAVSGASVFGIAALDTPSSNIRITQTSFQDNGVVDVRTDTANPAAHHSRVLILNNTMSGTLYGSALQNCGSSQATACEIRDNTIASVADLAGSGVDLNDSHYAIVSGNRISPCGNGLTVDDTRNASISQNTIQGCLRFGIVLANGARPSNRPWILSGNRVEDNTVSNNVNFGLASYRITTDPDNRNELNVWRNNRISGNTAGGCSTNADQNTFTGNGPQTCSPQR